MKILKPIALMLIPLCFYSCSDRNTADANAATKEVNVANMQIQYDKKEEQEPAPQKNRTDPSHTTVNTPAAKQDWDKKIIRNAILNVEVKDYKTIMYN